MSKFNIKIYNNTGTEVQQVSEKIRATPISFNSKVNGGCGVLRLTLNLDIFNKPDWLKLDTEKFIKIFLPRYSNTVPIYSGSIAKVIPDQRLGGTSGFTLECLGLITLLSRAKYKSGASYQVIHSGVDPSVIFKAVIDHFNTIYTVGWISYDAGDIETVGTNIDVEFNKVTHLEAIEKCIELAGENFYFFLKPSGKIEFKSRPTSANHLLNYKKVIGNLDSPKALDKLVNKVHVIYDGGSVNVIDGSSSYDLRERIIEANDAKDATTATQIGQDYLDSTKDLRTIGKMTINNQYTIETIFPGQKIAIENTKKDADIFDNNMFVAGTKFTETQLEIDIERIVNLHNTIKEVASTVATRKVSDITQSAAAITSVFGRTGAIAATINDYTWTQINKATSSIADITTKSHTLLTDIGSNTHMQIDIHIGDTSRHFLYGSINHNTILNTHNLTSDINHNTILNAHNLTSDINHNTILNAHNLTSDINHNTILNAHNLTSDIDHDSILNGAGNKHIDWTNASDNFDTIGTISGNFVQGSVLFAGANGVITQDNSNLFWDATNNRLKINKNIYSSITELILSQVGDLFGESGIKIQNRTGTNGAMIYNNTLDLIDFAFSPSAGTQGNLRYEHRSTHVVVGSDNTVGEYQFREAATVIAAFNSNASSIVNGNFLVGTTINAGFRLDVSGTIRAVDDAQFDSDVEIIGNCFVGDRGAESTAQVVNVITYTGTIPAASTMPIGTLAFKRATT